MDPLLRPLSRIYKLRPLLATPLLPVTTVYGIRSRVRCFTGPCNDCVPTAVHARPSFNVGAPMDRSYVDAVTGELASLPELLRDLAVLVLLRHAA